MQPPNDLPEEWTERRRQLIGLGESSTRKSYYAELQLRLAELERFRALLELSKEVILVIDPEYGRLLDFNESAVRQLGASRDELLGMTIWDLVDPAGRQQIAAHLAEDAPVSGRREIVLTSFRRKGASLVPIELTIRRLRVGDVPYGIVVARDISERLAAEAAIAQEALKLKQAQELDQLKTNFVNAVSHELRTPLTIILGYVELLDDEVSGPLNPPQHEYLHQIEVGSRRLEHLLSDLLDFARMDAGTFTLKRELLDLKPKIRELVEGLRVLIQEAGLTLEVDIEQEELPAWVDAGRIVQVLTNLLHNAIKFTPRGGRLCLKVAIEGDRLRCEIKDSGPGIPEEDLAKLFNRFTQLTAGVKSGAGTGLGLSISKALVEAHGGTIGVRSTPGLGTTFYFSIPTGAPAPELPAPGASPS